MDNQTAKTVIFMGAGISHCAGIPVQLEILDKICTNSLILKSKIGKIFIQFLKDNFNYYSGCKDYPSIEEIYSFLDFFISQNENLSSKYSVNSLKYIWQIFTQLICQVVEIDSFLANDKSREIYEEFWEKLLKLNHKFSIVTTNYDTCFYEAFDKFYKQGYFIDYHVDFANYYQDYSKNIHPFFWWKKPPIDVEFQKIVNVYKLHGSLDWLYCSNCNKILYTPFYHANYNLDNGRLKKPPLDTDDCFRHDIAKCPIDKCYYEILIVPPTYNKNFKNSVLKDLYFKALYELRNAENVIFIGYSFPDADYHIKALFNRVNMKHKKVIVMDKILDEEKVRKYRSICKNAIFKEISFEDCIPNFGSIVKKL